MHTSLTQHVARAMAEDRRRAARARGPQAAGAARPPGRPVRRRAAAAAVHVARRIDAEAARRAMTA